MKKPNLSLFEGFGIELEYMIVDAVTLSVKPIADKLLMQEGGSYSDVARGPIAWSNELVTHVIELKTNGAAPNLTDLPQAFHKDIGHINQMLLPMQARLLPTAMHPWMNPGSEAKLWPHEHNEVYAQFNRIFNCRGHGWSNLQSTHINLPFCGDAEFGALHAAIRLVLPLIPALCASSPMVDGKLNGVVDNRMQFYRNNAMRVPSVSGLIIPEPAYSRKEYEMNILGRIYQDLAPHDPEGVLQHEWVNARGAIARFERDAIEIRVIDVQECPLADISLAAAIVSVLKALIAETFCSQAEQRAVRAQPLAAILRETIVAGDAARITDAAYLALLGYTKAGEATAKMVWQHLIDTVWPSSDHSQDIFRTPLKVILEQGPLSRRIVKALGRDLSRDHQCSVYSDLAKCLAANKLFTP